MGKDLPTKAGDSEANRGKNRYPSILPCECKAPHNGGDYSERVRRPLRLMFAWSPCLVVDDHCRVRLSIQNQNPHSDYINANFVPVRAHFLIHITHGIVLSFHLA